MTINEHVTEFAGKPVMDWEPDTAISDPEGVMYRLRWGYDHQDSWLDKFAAFLDDQAADRVTGLVVGMWSNEDDEETAQAIIEALVAARDKLPKLTAIFVGDIPFDENEMSWIEQGSYGALWSAYPDLEHVCVRGGNGLDLGTLKLPKLRSLVIQTGGMPGSVMRQVAQADLRSLEHLELWLGIEDYGADWTTEDLAPILEGKQLPQVRTLGLRNSDQADALAALVVNTPIMSQLEVLDLSMGTLGDVGAQALLDSPAVLKLKKLDLHHHYCSDEMMKKLQALPIKVDLHEQETSDGDEQDRYVAVGE